MAIGVTLDFPAITTDQYDRTCALMGLTPRGAVRRASCSTGPPSGATGC